jgi:hypothetical protein
MRYVWGTGKRDTGHRTQDIGFTLCLSPVSYVLYPVSRFSKHLYPVPSVLFGSVQRLV